MKQILIISRPVDDRMRGTGVSASTYWLMNSLRRSFEIIETTKLPLIPTHHSIASVIFYDFLVPIWNAIFYKIRRPNCILIADVAQAPTISFIKLLYPRTPVVTIIADYFDPKLSRTGIYTKYLNIVTKHALRNSDYVIATAEENKRDFLKISMGDFIPNVVTLPLGLTIIKVDTIHYPRKSNNKEFLNIGYLGSSHPRKRLDRCVALAKIAAELHSYIHFIFAGNIDEEILHSIKSAGGEFCTIDNRKNISEAEKTKFYEDIDVFFFPTQLEGFGLPIIESFFYRRPCIIMKSAIIPEVVRKGAIEISDNMTEIPNLLIKLRQPDTTLQNAVEENRKYAESFNWKNYSDFFASIC